MILPQPLSGERVVLKGLSEKHATERYAHWLNDPLVNKYLETRSVTLRDLEKYIAEKNASDDALFVGIFWKENDEHIGNIKLEPIDTKKKRAMVGILIGESAYWGKGVATEAINLLAGYAKTLGMTVMDLGVISENTAAIRAYEKCGFTVVETQKNAINHDGTLYDRIVMERKLA